MSASGSAWIKPTKQRGLRASAITDAPHPTLLRPGQRFFPLESRASTRATLRIVKVRAEHCEARREDTSGRTVRLDATRLLAVDEHGAGLHYRFVGYASRPGYATHACIVALEEPWAQLICPEWHPAMPIAVAAAGLPPGLRAVGSWVACKADLGATSPARTGLHALSAPARSFEPSRLHPIAPAAEPESAEGTATAEDVVLFLPPGLAAGARAGERGVYVTGHPPPTGPGCRAYVSVDGAVMGWRSVAAVVPLPNGTRVELDGPWHPVAIDATAALPRATMAAGGFGHQAWTRRTWARGDERAPGD